MSGKRFRDERTGAEFSEDDLKNRIVPGDVYEVSVTSEDEAETDRFLADLGRAYREDLARKIADRTEELATLAHGLPTVREIVLEAANEVLGKE